MISYKSVGIDLKKIRLSQNTIGQSIISTHKIPKNVHVIHGFDHYAGIIKINNLSIALHTDGVGTKTLIASLMNKYSTVGIDCVAMNVNDIICVGAKPISFVDYIAANQNNRKIFKKIIDGVVQGAKKSKIAIIGGETSIMPDLISGEIFNFDLAGTVVGTIQNNIIDKKIEHGDNIIGIDSSGLHSNGYSLVRKILLSKYSLKDKIKNIGILGNELLTPTEIYVDPILEMLKKCNIHGLAHITGGGFTKLLRLCQTGFNLYKMPKIPPIMKLIQEEGNIQNTEMYRTFNMGIGFCIIAPATETKTIVSICKNHNMKCQKIGEIINKIGVFINDEKVIV